MTLDVQLPAVSGSDGVELRFEPQTAYPSHLERDAMTGDDADIVRRVLTRYVSVWNERDPQVRRATGADVFTPDARYVDPNTSAEGRSAIDTYVGGWQKQFAGMVFLLGEVKAHHDVAHFHWSFGPPGGSPVAKGWDVVVIQHGRISKVYGFFG